MSRRQLLGAAGLLCSAAGLLGQPQQAYAIFQTPDGFRAQVDRYAGWDATRSHSVVGLGRDNRLRACSHCLESQLIWASAEFRPLVSSMQPHAAPCCPSCYAWKHAWATMVVAELAHALSRFTVSWWANNLNSAIHMLQA
jgi:hypothetical protein